MVTGEAILGANIFRDFFAGIRDIVGGRSGAYEKELRKARDIAFKELGEQAKALGADAVVGIDIDYGTGRERCQHADGERKRYGGENPSMKRSLSTLLLAILLAGCASEEGIVDKGAYELDTRHQAQAAYPRIKVLVIHYTADDFDTSLATLTDKNVSSHYLIPAKPPAPQGKPRIWRLTGERAGLACGHQLLAWHQPHK